MKHQYYIPYDEKARVNYILLISLYNLAEYNPQTKLYDTIRYTTINDLANRVNKEYEKYKIKPLSNKTIGRALNDIRYEPYFSVNSSSKVITLRNDIRGLSKFVVLGERDIDFLVRYNDKMLTKYLLYLKYYCYRSNSKAIDSTLEQILAAIGYSYRSHDNLSKLSHYNGLMVEAGMIAVKKYRDNNGFERNAYRFN